MRWASCRNTNQTYSHDSQCWPPTFELPGIRNSSYLWPFDERSCIMRNVNGNVCAEWMEWRERKKKKTSRERANFLISNFTTRACVWLHNPFLRLVLTLHLTEDLYRSLFRVADGFYIRQTHSEQRDSSIHFCERERSIAGQEKKQCCFFSWPEGKLFYYSFDYIHHVIYLRHSVCSFLCVSVSLSLFLNKTYPLLAIKHIKTIIVAYKLY